MKILVANRAEIAVRILRSCREMGLPTVAVYTSADQVAQHTRLADEAVSIGGPGAYASIPAILEAARKTGAQAIHPGYGFLAENAAFARAVEEAGLTFIGPLASTIEKMGDKLEARRIAREAGLPVLPGPDAPLPHQMSADLDQDIQYPVLVKAAAGGGGRGIRLAHNRDELHQEIAAARQEALRSFGDDTVYLEPLVQSARHIEVQVLGDGRGKVLTLGERECSLQRRRQKLIEEAPAPGLDPDLHAALFAAALRFGQALNYRGLGTVEFLLDAAGNFHFIEMNPRIQVEHPVTEMISGIDLVREQITLALTGALAREQTDVSLRGAAIEARVLAEDAHTNFTPAAGEVTYIKEPAGPFVRVDSALHIGMPVTTDYDSLLAKVIAWGEDRPQAIQRLRRALFELQIGGVPTILPFLVRLIDSPQFRSGEVDTTTAETFTPEQPDLALEREAALAAALHAHLQREGGASGANTGQPASQWRAAAWHEQMHGQ